jgi:hypothetical protein
MSQVNSRGESQAQERDFEVLRPAQGAQPSAKNGRVPRLLRADQQPERLSAQAMLAEGEELSSNPLLFVFKELQTTRIAVDVA